MGRVRGLAGSPTVGVCASASTTRCSRAVAEALVGHPLSAGGERSVGAGAPSLSAAPLASSSPAAHVDALAGTSARAGVGVSTGCGGLCPFGLMACDVVASCTGEDGCGSDGGGAGLLVRLDCTANCSSR